MRAAMIPVVATGHTGVEMMRAAMRRKTATAKGAGVTIAAGKIEIVMV